MVSTIGGLSLSTNVSSNPYYWVCFGLRLILVARREESRLSLVPGSLRNTERFALKVHRRKAIINEELRSFGGVGPCLFDLR